VRPAARALGVQPGAAHDQPHGRVDGDPVRGPGAAILAAVWLGQTPPAAAVPALALLLAGVAMVILSGGRRTPAGLAPT
jgi:hypothetical protein